MAIYRDPMLAPKSPAWDIRPRDDGRWDILKKGVVQWICRTKEDAEKWLAVVRSKDPAEAGASNAALQRAVSVT
jgi:hypothetical protein